MANERWDDERLDRLADGVVANQQQIQANQQQIQANSTAIGSSRQDIQVLLEGQTRLQNLQVELGETQSRLGRNQELLVEVLADVRTNLTELRAGQERQERILDYLLRRDGERN